MEGGLDFLQEDQKKLIISEIRFDEPAVRIYRDKKGKFNFSTLAVLSEGKPQSKAEKPKPTRMVVAMAVAVGI